MSKKLVTWHCYPYKNGRPLKLLSAYWETRAYSEQEALQKAMEYYRKDNPDYISIKRK